MFSRFGFASFYSPLTLLLRFLPFLIVSFVFSLTILCSTSSYLPPLLFCPSTDSEMFSSFIQSCGRTKGKKKRASRVLFPCDANVSSCRVEFEEVVMLSGITGDVGGGVVLCVLTDAQCQLSRPRSRPGRRWAGVLALWHPSPPSLTYTRVYTVNTCAHMQRGPHSCCCGDLLWVVICSFAHYGRSATHE